MTNTVFNVCHTMGNLPVIPSLPTCISFWRGCCFHFPAFQKCTPDRSLWESQRHVTEYSQVVSDIIPTLKFLVQGY